MISKVIELVEAAMILFKHNHVKLIRSPIVTYNIHLKDELILLPHPSALRTLSDSPI